MINLLLPVPDEKTRGALAEGSKTHHEKMGRVTTLTDQACNLVRLLGIKKPQLIQSWGFDLLVRSCEQAVIALDDLPAVCYGVAGSLEPAAKVAAVKICAHGDGVELISANTVLPDAVEKDDHVTRPSFKG
jgi:hypothetical protein